MRTHYSSAAPYIYAIILLNVFVFYGKPEALIQVTFHFLNLIEIHILC